MADEKMRLIRARNEKRASFKRQCLHQKKKLDDVWRRPRGLQSKQRIQKRAKGRHPKSGFGGPAAVRGFHPSGYEEVLVFRVEDIEGLNVETHGIRIAAKVGNKKREIIQAKALELGLKVFNLKDASLKAAAEKPEDVEEVVAEEVVAEEDVVEEEVASDE
ncbi:50S ribosomal protein L32e [Methanogenium marinum]|uniref:Large ribosomal subunit protein eL32 n=1 Tax=Methanogenium marinum TaxID=348610 RepID=A0A9Q4KTP5_9EURY|nr:50S ribosomal protein L32e [Methanogenium marinum]MDE4907822.1 50S ribosomal protein L32e [Methanogenium marinum]